MATHGRTIRLGMACVTLVVALTLFSIHPVLALSTTSTVQGKAENVGSGKNNGKLQVRGEVLGVGPLDLSAATLRLTDLLRESTEVGELVRDSVGPLPLLQLTARHGSKATAAIFETPS